MPFQKMLILKKRSDFLRLRQGKSVGTSAFLLATRCRTGDGREDEALNDEEARYRVGFTVTKKTGNAVTRNRIKRRLKEAARQIFPEFGQPGFDYVFIARKGALNRSFTELLDDMKRSLLSLSRMPK